ncbi:MAG: GtrA family protein [Clostridia bacterium]|nr:GtrA family protein [Clostridia bacterium]
MIDKIRELLFRIFKKESFLGRIIDKLFTKEIVTYVFFGVMTTVVNLITFYIFKRIFISIGWEGVFNSIIPEGSSLHKIFIGGTDYLDANFIAWIVGVVFAFITNKLWVFDSKSWTPSVAGKEFSGFMGARIFSFVIETISLFVLVTILSVNDFVAKIIVGIVVVIINYVFSKLIIFRKKPETEKNG